MNCREGRSQQVKSCLQYLESPFNSIIRKNVCHLKSRSVQQWTKRRDRKYIRRKFDKLHLISANYTGCHQAGKGSSRIRHAFLLRARYDNVLLSSRSFWTNIHYWKKNIVNLEHVQHLFGVFDRPIPLTLKLPLCFLLLPRNARFHHYISICSPWMSYKQAQRGV